MKIKKPGGSLAVAVSLLALSGVATAGDYFACTWEGDLPTYGNRDNTIKALISMAENLRCRAVHTKLARKLNEERTDVDSPPPKNKHGTNDAKGAANDLQKGGAKDESAILRLYSFMENIGNAVENPGKDADADAFVASAMDAIYCIKTL